MKHQITHLGQRIIVMPTPIDSNSYTSVAFSDKQLPNKFDTLIRNATSIDRRPPNNEIVIGYRSKALAFGRKSIRLQTISG